MNNQAIKKLESDLWEAADLLRQGSKLTSQQYCMPVLGLLFLRYAYSRFKKVEEEILKSRPVRNGRVLPIEASDFAEKSALFLPQQAQYSWLVNLPENIQAAGLTTECGQPMNSLGEVVNHAMELVEAQSAQLNGVLPREYTIFSDELLAELLRIFNNNALDQVGGDVIGRIYEYFLSKFAPAVASDDGVFFTPKSLVKMIVNVIEPSAGTLLDCACGSGGMFVQTGDFVNQAGMSANKSMTFFGQEKVEYNSSAKDPVNMAGFMVENIANGILKQWHLEDADRLPRDGSVTLLDTRTVEEFAHGHIDGFFNIPVDELRERLDELDKNKPVYVICQSGLRSYIACRILAGNGFDCYNFSGGFRFYDAVTNDRCLIESATSCGMDK